MPSSRSGQRPIRLFESTWLSAPSPAVAPFAGPAADLSPREREVLVLLALGHSYRKVAELLSLSVKTVETYRSRITEKLALRDRSDLVRYAIEKGLLGLTKSEPK